MENKKQNQFKNTFTRAELEDYVKKMLQSSEITMAEQKDRIVELKKEIDELKSTRSSQNEKFKTMTKAMNEATRIVKELRQDGALKLSIVIEKIKQFGFKWKNYFSQLLANDDDLASNNAPEIFECELIELLDELVETNNTRGSLEEKVVPTSKKRKVTLTKEEWLEKNIEKLSNEPEPEYLISDESEDRYKKVMEKLKNQMVFVSELTKQSDSGFDINEALNPTDSLDKIIGDLKD